MPDIQVDIGRPQDYGHLLDTLLKKVGSTGTTSVAISLDGQVSAEFQVRNTDLYITAFRNGVATTWQALSSENYNDMASPDNVSRGQIRNAIIDSATWAAVNTGQREKYLKLLIFVISEAARFMVVRFAVNRAVSAGQSFPYRHFVLILRNWSSLRDRVGKALITVADVRGHMAAVKPHYDESEAWTYLHAQNLLFA
jgi:hypothetical protein